MPLSGWMEWNGADDGIRTHDPHLGNVKLAPGQSTGTDSTRTFAHVS